LVLHLLDNLPWRYREALLVCGVGGRDNGKQSFIFPSDFLK